MNSVQPFSAQAKTLPISVTSTASTSAALPGVGNVVRIVNEGPSVAFVSIGVAEQTATLPNATPTATSTPVLAGTDISLTIPNAQAASANPTGYTAPTPLNISAICRSSGTATLDVQVGDGL